MVFLAEGAVIPVRYHAFFPAVVSALLPQLFLGFGVDVVVKLVAEDCTAPNGVALGPNQQKLYVADSKQKVIRVYDVAGDGSLRNSKQFAQCRGGGL